ncbi:disease resistance protein RPS5-like [Telopea speciosissima]|uniref:disease resistance protein RPS5-like n=1 Tax=Telopea speciosissima TaxID=54955 RepID=UPI001CC70174|nr:disease resistance protein RPS5-like [Telopea speciosissima]
MLDARRTDEQRKLEEAKKQEGVEASAQANLWLSRVNKAVSDSNSLRTEYEEQRRGHCSTWFCWSRFQLSKRMFKLKQDVDMLYEEEPKSGWTVAPNTSQKGRKLDTVSIKDQTTTDELMDEIIEAVLDDRYVVVGLHGMGGVGKTTLLRHINNHFINTEHFESVIFTTLSATPNFVEIRKQIAKGLGWDLDKFKDDEVLKEKLSRLFERRKYMLILDDMWEPIIDLHEICNIPSPKKDNGCKILMASRSVSVVTRFATRFAAKHSLELILVEKLTPDEAWTLFVQKVGEDITSNPTIEPLAKEVLRKCDGLPLAIVVIGGTMSTQETEGQWKDAVRELEQHSTSNVDGIEEEVFSKLIFSFEQLEPIQQSLFLYCCLFPEDWRFGQEEFLDFAIGEETLWVEMHKLEDVRNKIDVLVGKLRNSSMLEYDDDDDDETMKMHDVMREMALWIASLTTTSNKYEWSHKYIAMADARITEAPEASKWCKATKISLMENEGIESLPELRDQCPLLHTLLLEGCKGMKDIPQVHFLEHLSALRVLDLSETGIEKLPNLKELPPEIGSMVQLISLDLSDCESLRKLPVEIEKLNNLRRLDISDSEKLKRIPDGVLDKLEELDTVGSGLKWNENGIMELSQLTRLTSINIELMEVNVSSQLLKPLAKRICSLHLWNCDIDPLALPELVEDFPKLDIFVVLESYEGLTTTHVPTHYGYGSLTIRDCPDLKTLLVIGEEEEEEVEAGDERK